MQSFGLKVQLIMFHLLLKNGMSALNLQVQYIVNEIYLHGIS